MKVLVKRDLIKFLHTLFLNYTYIRAYTDNIFCILKKPLRFEMEHWDWDWSNCEACAFIVYRENSNVMTTGLVFFLTGRQRYRYFF